MRRRFMNVVDKVTSTPLYIEALEDNVTFTASFTTGFLTYNIDNGEYINISSYEQSLPINTGQRFYIKGVARYDSRKPLFTIVGKSKLGGSIHSVSYNDDFAQKIISDRCAHMFAGCDIVEVEKDFLNYPTLEDSCYVSMFSGCTSLQTAPELPATTLAVSCYGNMFSGCTSLQTAPELPATTLEDSCYVSMFSGCTSLQTAPELPATTLAVSCYGNMFRGCTKLNYIKMLAIDISATYCLTNWVSGVASSGTFVKNSAMTSLPTGEDGIPSGWTVLDSTFPTNEEGYPESTEFSFPLYLNCTNYDGEDDSAIYYSRPSDEISMALYEYLASLNIGVYEYYTFTTDEKIFFNRMPISEIENATAGVYCAYYENITFTVLEDGQIYMDYYK